MKTLYKCLQKSDKVHYNFNTVKNIRDPLTPREFQWKCVQVKFLQQLALTKSYHVIILIYS